MKKTYMQPTAQTVALAKQAILAGSITEGKNNFNTDDVIESVEDIAAKESSFNEEDIF